MFMSSFVMVSQKTKTIAHYNWKMTYQYLNDEEIKDGTFVFKNQSDEDNTLNYVNYKEITTGTFKNGKRNGLWKTTITYIDSQFGSDTYGTGTVVLIQNYIDDIANGVWKTNSSIKYRKRFINNSGFVYWGAFGPVKTSFGIVNFANGYLKPGVINYKFESDKTPSTKDIKNISDDTMYDIKRHIMERDYLFLEDIHDDIAYKNHPNYYPKSDEKISTSIDYSTILKDGNGNFVKDGDDYVNINDGSKYLKDVNGMYFFSADGHLIDIKNSDKYLKDIKGNYIVNINKHNRDDKGLLIPIEDKDNYIKNKNGEYLQDRDGLFISINDGYKYVKNADGSYASVIEEDLMYRKHETTTPILKE